MTKQVNSIFKKGKPAIWFTLFYTFAPFGVNALIKYCVKKIPDIVNGARRDLSAQSPDPEPLWLGRHRYLPWCGLLQAVFQPVAGML
jgi:hypothetical protein